MKRRNFCMSLVGAAVAAALPASAFRDILIHKGNPVAVDVQKGALHLMYDKPRSFYYYQAEALRQMNFYQQGARIHINIERDLGKTILHTMNYADVEKRVLALLDTKQKLA